MPLDVKSPPMTWWRSIWTYLFGFRRASGICDRCGYRKYNLLDLGDGDGVCTFCWMTYTPTYKE